eukprot:UN04949
MIGEANYRRALQSMYEENDTAFLTPCELFKPYYSKAVVRWMLSARKHMNNPLKILEVGGGNGSFCP